MLVKMLVLTSVVETSPITVYGRDILSTRGHSSPSDDVLCNEMACEIYWVALCVWRIFSITGLSTAEWEASSITKEQ
jgi:hypothetical protein